MAAANITTASNKFTSTMSSAAFVGESSKVTTYTKATNKVDINTAIDELAQALYQLETVKRQTQCQSLVAKQKNASQMANSSLTAAICFNKKRQQEITDAANKRKQEAQDCASKHRKKGWFHAIMFAVTLVAKVCMPGGAAIGTLARVARSIAKAVTSTATLVGRAISASKDFVTAHNLNIAINKNDFNKVGLIIEGKQKTGLQLATNLIAMGTDLYSMKGISGASKFTKAAIIAKTLNDLTAITGDITMLATHNKNKVGGILEAGLFGAAAQGICLLLPPTVAENGEIDTGVAIAKAAINLAFTACGAVTSFVQLKHIATTAPVQSASRDNNKTFNAYCNKAMYVAGQLDIAMQTAAIGDSVSEAFNRKYQIKAESIMNKLQIMINVQMKNTQDAQTAINEMVNKLQELVKSTFAALNAGARSQQADVDLLTNIYQTNS